MSHPAAAAAHPRAARHTSWRRSAAAITATALSATTLLAVAARPAAAAATSFGLTATAFRMAGDQHVDNVKLDWAPVPGAANYAVRRSADGTSGSFTTVATVAGTTYDDDGLALDKTYSYEVQALDSSAQSVAQTSAASATTFTKGTGYQTYDNTKASTLNLKPTLKANGIYYRYDYQATAGQPQIVEKTSTDGITFDSGRVVLTAQDICGSSTPALTTCKLESVHVVANPTTGGFVLVAHFENQSDYTVAQLLIAQGMPGGSFNVTYNARPLDNESRDATVFVDGANAYVLSATNNNADLDLYQLNSDWSEPATLISTPIAGQNREAPALINENGVYFLFSSAAAGWYPSQSMYATATNLAGPWSALKPIGDATTFGTQSGGIVTIGDRVAMVASRWGAQWKYPESSNSGRLLPLSFDGEYASFDLYASVDYSEGGSGEGATSAIIPVQDGQNLSVGRPVRATDAAAPNGAPAANDGVADDTANYYMPTADAVPFTWEVDLQKAAQISRVNMTTKLVNGSETYYTYKIEGSLDRKSYTTIYDGTANKAVGFQSDAITDTSAYRYIKVTVTGITNIQNGNAATWARGINELSVYGTPTGQAALDTVETPTVSVPAGTYYAPQTVTLATATPGATIYYTTDGSAPSATNGTAYTDQIAVSTTTTVKAVAVKDGLLDSATITNKYTVKDGSTPVALVNPVYAAAYVGQQPNLPTSVQVKTAAGDTKTAAVTWDLNGYSFDQPYRTAIVYGSVDGGLAVSGTVETVPTSVKYFVDSGTADATSPSFEGVKSLVGADLINQVSDESSNDNARWGYNATNGGYGGTQTSSTPQDKDSNGIYGVNNSGSWLRYDVHDLPAGTYTLTAGFREWWSGPRTMNVIMEDSTGTQTTIASDVAVANKTGYPLSAIASGTFTQAAGGDAIFYLQRSAGSEAPAVGWFAIAAGEVAVDTTPATVAAPTADVDAGVYKSAQSVTLNTATDGAAIYYTLDGTDPSRTNGSLYAGPVSVDKSETLKAVAFKNGLLSTITQRAYDIAPVPANGYSAVPVGKAWYDTAGNPIQAHGGNFVQKDGWYYWVGENRSNNSALFNGVSLYRSHDLVNWEYVHDILTLDTPGMCDSGNYSDTTCKLERPKLLYNAATGKYVLWGHWERADGYDASHLLVATSDTIDGDYTIVRNFRPGAGSVTTDDADPTYTGGDSNWGYGSRDFTVFQDPASGDAYLVTAQDGLRMRVYKLNDDYTDVDWQDSYVLFDGSRREAPALVKAGDYYFLFTSSQSGWYPNQAMYSYTKDISDPDGWSPLAPVGNNTTFYSQPTSIMTLNATDGSPGYVYVGDRWNPSQLGASTYVELPLKFDGLDTDQPSVQMKYDPAWSMNAATGKISPTQDTLVSENKPILDATSAASSTYSASEANDGNYFNLNTSGDDTNFYQPATVPYSWSVDLGKAYALSRIDLSFRSYNGSETYSGYTVQGSNDGDEWTTLVGETANTVVGFKSNPLTGSYRYVRVDVSKVVNDHNGSEADWAAGLVEAQVYADTTAPVVR